MSTGGNAPLVPKGLPRIVDLAAASLGMVVLSPVFLLIALAVKTSSAGPVMFRQQRVGRVGQLFTLLKFRSMEERIAGPEITARGDSRVTRIGRLLRRSKLDELPSLWNVARGEMALVGPRPEVPRYVQQSDPQWALILATRPGLTDPVTLRLRNEEDLLASVEDPERFYRETLQPFKLNAYVEYLKTRSPGSDAKVLVSTLLAVLNSARTPPPTLEEIQTQIGPDRDRNPLSSSTD